MLLSPKISIITVVFNDRDHIERTILSVINQTYKNIEYIIVDGESTDGTFNVISGFDEIAVVISEPDSGLYDAMNKGLQKATGDYVWYLNSGDQVYSRDTVQKMVDGLADLPDIIYGGTMIIDEDQKEIGDRRLKPPDRLSWKSFKQGMVVCHQSIIVKREIAPTYNLKYKISADIDWVIRAAKNAPVIHHSNMVLSKFLEGGLSGNNIKKGLRERFQIMTRFYGFIPTLLRHFLFGIRLTNFYLKHRRI
ncbi:MAG: glycosyltransferase [Bacteroidales bacterium]|nr:glycosyltransferase [Bacteroidales bacterium]